MDTDNLAQQVVGIVEGVQVEKDLSEGVYTPVWTQLGDWAARSGPASVAGMFMLSGNYCHVSVVAHGVVTMGYGTSLATVSLPIEPEVFVGPDGVIGAVSVATVSVGGNKILGFVSAVDGSTSALLTLDQATIGDGVSSVGATFMYRVR